jgi:hypothetical protein
MAEHMGERLEMVERALAEAVTFLRGEVMCPFHRHVDTYILTPEGPSHWHGPACEALELDCEFRMARKALVDMACEALGTENMTEFIL